MNMNVEEKKHELKLVVVDGDSKGSRGVDRNFLRSTSFSGVARSTLSFLATPF
jgi:hypothetical protein